LITDQKPVSKRFFSAYKTTKILPSASIRSI